MVTTADQAIAGLVGQAGPAGSRFAMPLTGHEHDGCRGRPLARGRNQSRTEGSAHHVKRITWGLRFAFRGRPPLARPFRRGSTPDPGSQRQQPRGRPRMSADAQTPKAQTANTHGLKSSGTPLDAAYDVALLDLDGCGLPERHRHPRRGRGAAQVVSNSDITLPGRRGRVGHRQRRRFRRQRAQPGRGAPGHQSARTSRLKPRQARRSPAHPVRRVSAPCPGARSAATASG